MDRAEEMSEERRVDVWRDSLPPLRIAALPVPDQHACPETGGTLLLGLK